MSKGFKFISKLGLTLLGLVTITFFIARWVPSDPILAIVGEHASPAIYNKAKAEWGFDKPLLNQYFFYVKNLSQGNLGRSLFTTHLVTTDLKAALPATFELASFALVLALIIGLPLGAVAALYQNQWPDQLARGLSLAASSISIFWLGLIGLMIFYVQLDWLPGPGRLDVFMDPQPITGALLIDSLIQGDLPLFKDALWHLILPGAILAFFKIGPLCRMTRSFILEQLSHDYVLGAQLRGLTKSRIFINHILPNAALPLITFIALSYGTLLEGSTFIETIFLWPGLGFYLSQAILHADMNAILGATLVIGTIFLTVNHCAAKLQNYLDPRLKLS